MPSCSILRMFETGLKCRLPSGSAGSKKIVFSQFESQITVLVTTTILIVSVSGIRLYAFSASFSHCLNVYSLVMVNLSIFERNQQKKWINSARTYNLFNFYIVIIFL